MNNNARIYLSISTRAQAHQYTRGLLRPKSTGSKYAYSIGSRTRERALRNRTVHVSLSLALSSSIIRSLFPRRGMKMRAARVAYSRSLVLFFVSRFSRPPAVCPKSLSFRIKTRPRGCGDRLSFKARSRAVTRDGRRGAGEMTFYAFSICSLIFSSARASMNDRRIILMESRVLFFLSRLFSFTGGRSAGRMKMYNAFKCARKKRLQFRIG